MKLSRIRPSPAMVVAVIALIAGVSGGAYAALSKNSVGSKQLKKGAVKTVDIKNDAVTGKKVNESSLGEVPSAASANSFGGMTAQRIAPFTLSDGGSQVIGTFGAFTLTATCSLNEGGSDYARIALTTSQNDSAFKGEADDADLDVGEEALFVESEPEPTGLPDLEEDGGVAIAPDGTEILGHQLYAGVNIFGQSGICRFGGVVFST